MSILQIWAILMLQLIICREKTEALTVAPKSCLLSDQSTADIKISPTNPQPVEQGNIDLKCHAPNPIKPKFRWFRNGTPIEHPTTQNDLDYITESVLTIQPSKEDNQAEFYCSVWSESQQKELNTCYVTLDVRYPPKIFMSTYPEMLEIGAPGRLDCFVDANPVPVYIYLKGNETNVADFSYDKETKKYRTSVNFSPFNQRDSGYYTCVAYNDHGLAKQNLTVEVQLQARLSTSDMIGYIFAGIISFLVVAIIVVGFVRYYQGKPFLPQISASKKPTRKGRQTDLNKCRSKETA